jgi:hypothetical protein
MANTVKNGKGSKRRPGKPIAQEDWDTIFSKKNKEEKPKDAPKESGKTLDRDVTQ